MTTPPPSPARRALGELDILLGHVIRLRDAGDRNRYNTDDACRWALHRLWIAIGNEARAYPGVAGRSRYRAQPWAALYVQRNILARQRLADIDDNRIWRATALRAEQQFRPRVRAALT